MEDLSVLRKKDVKKYERLRGETLNLRYPKGKPKKCKYPVN